MRKTCSVKEHGFCLLLPVVLKDMPGLKSLNQPAAPPCCSLTLRGSPRVSAFSPLSCRESRVFEELFPLEDGA